MRQCAWTGGGGRLGLGKGRDRLEADQRGGNWGKPIKSDMRRPVSPKSWALIYLDLANVVVVDSFSCPPCLVPAFRTLERPRALPLNQSR